MGRCCNADGSATSNIANYEQKAHEIFAIKTAVELQQQQQENGGHHERNVAQRKQPTHHPYQTHHLAMQSRNNYKPSKQHASIHVITSCIFVFRSFVVRFSASKLTDLSRHWQCRMWTAHRQSSVRVGNNHAATFNKGYLIGSHIGELHRI